MRSAVITPDKGTEAERAECSGPCSWDVAVLGLEPRQLCGSFIAQF